MHPANQFENLTASLYGKLADRPTSWIPKTSRKKGDSVQPFHLPVALNDIVSGAD